MSTNIIIVHKVDTNDNLSSILTKSLPGWKCVQLLSRILYSDGPDIYLKSS